MSVHSVLPILFVLLCFYNTRAHQHCTVENFMTQEDFDLQRYLGIWYEIKWLPQSYIPEYKLYKDYKHNYTAVGNDTVHMAITGRDPVNLAVCFSTTAQLTYTNSTTGKFQYTRKINATAYLTADYWVVDTDYTSYAVVYGCREVNVTSGKCDAADSWVWSRTTSLTDQQMTTVDTTLENLCLNLTQFAATTQSGKDCVVSGSGIIQARFMALMLALLVSIMKLN